MTKRKYELSFMNVMLCIFVVLIHILSYPIAQFSPGGLSPSTVKHDLVLIPSQLVSFAVQGFVFMSGLKLFLGGRDSIKYTQYLKKRLLFVVLPYILAFAVYYVYFAVVYDYPVNDVKFILEHLFCGSLVYHLYFIPLIVQFDLLLPLWRRIVNRFSPVIVIPAALFAGSFFELYLPSLTGVFTGSPAAIMNDRLFTTYIGFWICGCYIGKYYGEFREICRKCFGLLAVFFSVSAAVLAVFSHFFYNRIYPVGAMNEIKYFYAVCAILFFTALFGRIPQNVYDKIPALSLVDKHSYGMYLMHVLPLTLTDTFIIEKFGIQSQTAAFALRVVTAYGGTLGILCAFSFVKKGMLSILKRKTEQ